MTGLQRCKKDDKFTDWKKQSDSTNDYKNPLVIQGLDYPR